MDDLHLFLSEAQKAGVETTLLKGEDAAKAWVQQALHGSQRVLLSGTTLLTWLSHGELHGEVVQEWWQCWDAPDAVGMVEAAGGIARTGTVLLLAKDPIVRVASLVPDRVWILLRGDRIYPDFEEAFRAITPDQARYLLLLRGPSVTADIEKEIVHGVHGPRWISVGVWLP